MLEKFGNPEKRKTAFEALERVYLKWHALIDQKVEPVLAVVGESCVGQDDCRPPLPKDDTPTFQSRRPALLADAGATQTVNSGPTATFVVEGSPHPLTIGDSAPEGLKTPLTPVLEGQPNTNSEQIGSSLVVPEPLPEKATLTILGSCLNPRFLRAELPDHRKVSIMILRGRKYRLGIQMNCRLQQPAQAIYVPLQ